MLSLRLGLPMIAAIALSAVAFAADLETQVIDKNCYIEVFDDDDFDMDDAHYKIQGERICVTERPGRKELEQRH